MPPQVTARPTGRRIVQWACGVRHAEPARASTAPAAVAMTLPALGSLPLATTTTEGRTVSLQAYLDKAYPRSRARSTSSGSHRDASIVLRLDGVAARSAEG